MNTQYTDEISVTELRDLQLKKVDFLLLDVREPFEYEICHLDGKLIPLKNLQDRLIELDKNKYIVVHCRSGHRSRQAMELLKAHGFSKVTHLQGGILAWIDKIDNAMKKY